MSDSVIYPNVLWCVENLTPICKKSGPVIPLLLAKWKLKLTTYNCIGGDKVQLFLKREPDTEYCVDSYFFVVTSISGSDGQKYLEKSMRIPTNSEKLCIWEATSEQMTNCNLNFEYCVNFFVSFQPGTDWKSFGGLKLESEKQMRPSLPVLSQDLASLLFSGSHSDVVLTCQDQKFTAHKSILSARSDTFRARLQGVGTCQQEVLEITDIEATVLERLLLYIYTGEIPESSPSAQNVYRAAVKYGVGCWSNFQRTRISE